MPSRLPKPDEERDARATSYSEYSEGGKLAKNLAFFYMGLAAVGAVFGFVFLVVGGLHIQDCTIEPMIPIWLIVQGVIMFISLIMVVVSSRQMSKGKVSLPIKILDGAIGLVFIVWFVIGNVWVYRAYAQQPDFAHSWFENGCDMALFNLAFSTVIVLDALIVLAVIAACVWALAMRRSK